MTYDPSTDLDAARANVAGAEHDLAFSRRILQEAVDREAEVAAKPDAQEWEAEAARGTIEARQRIVAGHEDLLRHHRGVFDAMAAGG